MVILGLDISTNTTGYAFLEKQKILEMGFIDISKTKIMKEKAMFVFDALEEISHFDDIEKIYLLITIYYLPLTIVGIYYDIL